MPDISFGDYQKEYQKEYRSRPYVKEKARAYKKKYENRPEVKAKKLALKRERNKSAKAKFNRSIYLAEYCNRPEVKARAKKYMSKEEVKEKYRDGVKRRTQKARREVIEYYGGKCSCCGEDRIEFLAIDHINGGGLEERKKYRGSGWYYYLRKNKPSHLRILCHNCNMSIGLYGYCPHQKEEK